MDTVSGIGTDSQLEFCRSIIGGVEIKLCRNEPYVYKPHLHNELSLGYIIEGSTVLTLSDRTIRFKAGDGVMIQPLMTHRCAPDDIDHWAYIMLFVDPGYYSGIVSFRGAKRLTGSPIRKLKGFIEQLLDENIPDTRENILIELLLEFADKDASEDNPPDLRGSITAIHDYILEHVREDITLDKLQALFGLSKFSIIRNFRKHYMTTPAAFHLQHRVAEAKSLMGNGADIFEICGELRFYDQAHLIREFKKMYGVTPGAYMEQLRG
jgi:AraC-like DNA-binding protein